MYSSKKKVCLLSIHPAPYRDPVFKLFSDKDLYDLTVIYYFKDDEGHRVWDYNCRSLYRTFAKYYCKLSGSDGVHFSILLSLIKYRYDVVLIPGYSRYNSFVAILYCLLTKTPYILSSDKIKSIIVSPKRFKKIKKYIENKIINNANALWVPGNKSRQYYNSIMVENKKIFEGSYCLESEIISNNDIVKKKKEAHSILCTQYGFEPNAIILLTVGMFKSFRMYPNLLHAISKVNKLAIELPPFYLLMIGDGTQKNKINEIKNQFRIDNVILCGNVTFSSLKQYYYGSNIFIHPGAEPYSTALEYAALTNLTIVSTREVGYIQDYINFGGYPYLVDIDDVNSLVNALLLVLNNSFKNSNKNLFNQNLISSRSVNWASNELHNAIDFVINCNK